VEKKVHGDSRRLLQLKELIRLVRGDLDWVVMKCLEKDRTRRYPSANDLAVDLQRYLNYEPVTARPPSRRYQLLKFVRRNRIQVAFGVSVAAAVVLGLVFALVGFAKARHERDRALASERKAETGEEKARTEAARSAQVAGLLKQMLKGVGPSAALGRDTTMLREILEHAAQGLQQELAGQPEVEADLRSTLGDVYLDLGEYTNAVAMHSEALRLRKKVYGGEHLDVAASLYKLAGAREMQRDVAEAERLFRQSLAIRRKLLGNKHPDVASTLNRLASTLQMQGGSKIAEANRAFAESEMLSREFLATGQTFSHNEALDVAKAMSRLTVVLLRQGRYSEAEEAGRQALTFQRKIFADNPLRLDGALGDLTAALLHQGKWTEAEPLVREELAIYEKLTPGGWDALRTRSKLGGLLLQQKEYDQAEPLLLSAYEGITRQADSGSSRGKGRRKEAVARLVQLYEETGKTKEATEWKQKLAELSDAGSEKASGP
jgi:tetratricopeptide (TPR) repeat protein